MESQDRSRTFKLHLTMTLVFLLSLEKKMDPDHVFDARNKDVPSTA